MNMFQEIIHDVLHSTNNEMQKLQKQIEVASDNAKAQINRVINQIETEKETIMAKVDQVTADDGNTGKASELDLYLKDKKAKIEGLIQEVRGHLKEGE